MKASGKEIVLVGTVHRDPKGYEALLKVLYHHRPEVVTVEVSPYGLTFRRKKRELLERQDLPLGLKAFLEIPYEYKAAKAYGAEHGVPVIPIDLCPYSKRFLRDLMDLFSNSVKVDASVPLQQYNIAILCWDDPTLARAFLKHLDPKRERALAKRVFSTFMRFEKNLMHIGGWTHMLPLPETLFGLLRPLKPKRILLLPEGGD